MILAKLTYFIRWVIYHGKMANMGPSLAMKSVINKWSVVWQVCRSEVVNKLEMRQVLLALSVSAESSTLTKS
jgi:hypothetical protein